MDLQQLSSEELIEICVESSHAEAWMEFVRRFRKPIALTVLRICRSWGVNSQSAADDLIQETYLRLCSDQCRLLRTFQAAPGVADPLVALVKVVAANVAYDYFRNRTAQKRGGIQNTAAQDLPDEEVLSDFWRGAKDLEMEVQIREIERALLSAPAPEISSRERLIFRLYFRQGLTAAAIAAIPAVELSIKGVESAIFRVSRYLRLRLNPEGQGISERLNKGKTGRIPIKQGGV